MAIRSLSIQIAFHTFLEDGEEGFCEPEIEPVFIRANGSAVKFHYNPSNERENDRSFVRSYQNLIRFIQKRCVPIYPSWVNAVLDIERITLIKITGRPHMFLSITDLEKINYVMERLFTQEVL